MADGAQSRDAEPPKGIPDEDLLRWLEAPEMRLGLANRGLIAFRFAGLLADRDRLAAELAEAERKLAGSRERNTQQHYTAKRLVDELVEARDLLRLRDEEAKKLKAELERLRELEGLVKQRRQRFADKWHAPWHPRNDEEKRLDELVGVVDTRAALLEAGRDREASG